MEKKKGVEQVNELSPLSFRETLFEGIVVFSDAGEIQWMNSRAREILDCSEEEIGSFSRFARRFLQTTDSAEAALKHLSNARNDNDEPSVVKIQTRSGQEKWCKFILSRLSRDHSYAIHILDDTECRSREDDLAFSERRFRALFEESKDAISISGSARLVNQAWLDMFGYVRDDLECFDASVLYVNPEDRERYLAELDKKGFVKDYPVTLRRKNGEEIDCLYTTTMCHEKEKNYIQGIIRDVTPWKKAVAALQESRERLMGFMDSATDSFFLFDSSLNMVEINRKARKEFSLNDKNILGMSLLAVLKNIRFPVDAAPFIRVHNTGEPIKLNALALDDSFMDFHIFRVGNGIGVIATNITGRKRAELALQKAHSELELRVKERTAELYRLNLNLEREINERKQFEDALRRARDELESRVRERTRVLAGANRKLEKEIREREKAERMLKFQAVFLQHISSICANFINLSVHDIDSGVIYALSVFGIFIGVDRGFIFAYDHDENTFRASHEWHAEHAQFQPGVHLSFSAECFHWTVEQLKKFQIVYAPHVSEIPLEAAADKKQCALLGIASYIAVPLIQGRRLTGMLIFGSSRENNAWEKESCPLLELVGEIVVNALERREVGLRILEYQEKLRSLASELTLAEERERRRIAVELHDRIGQALAVSRIKLGSLKEKMSFDGLAEKIDEISEFINQAITDTRSLIFEISPPVLYDLGLEAALEWLTDQMGQRHGIQAVFRDDGIQRRLDDDMNVLLFQFVRELLLNVVKHAKATSVAVTLRRKESVVEIEVEDNGIGFDIHASGVRSTGSLGFGLISIRERLDHLGGFFHIFSKPGCGARVVLTAPVGTA